MPATAGGLVWAFDHLGLVDAPLFRVLFSVGRHFTPNFRVKLRHKLENKTQLIGIQRQKINTTAPRG